MYTKILVPLDGSELAEKVLPHVETIALGTGAQVILLRVPVYPYVEPSAAAQMAGWYMPELSREVTESVRKEAEEYLIKIRNQLGARGVKVSTVLKEGSAGEVIIGFAREAAVDLIAMTTHGRTGLSRVIFGSVAEEVLHGVDKPVLLIRSQLLEKAKA